MMISRSATPYRKMGTLLLAIVTIIGITRPVFATDTTIASFPLPISQDILDALTRGDINSALLALRDQPSSPKLLYLTREVMHLSEFLQNPHPKKTEAHHVYQNAGIAYHNLYLFLKARGIDQRHFFKQARRLYHKARGAGTPLHRAECDVLVASLLGASGKIQEAQKAYSRVDTQALRADFASAEYLASYHAAVGNVEGTLDALRYAYSLRAEEIRAWVEISDDFWKVQDDPRFVTLITTWKENTAGDGLTLSVPRSGEAQFEMETSPVRRLPPAKMHGRKKHRGKKKK